MTFKIISLVRVDDGDADPASPVEGMPWQIDIANAIVELVKIRYRQPFEKEGITTTIKDGEAGKTD